MGSFVWALAAFVGLHVGVSATGLRAKLAGAMGEGFYRALFSIASAILLAWLIWSIGQVRGDPFNPLNAPLWAPPDWLRWPATLLIALGIVLLTAGILTPGPTLAGFEKKGLSAAEPARGVLRVTRHPFLWGVALWGAGHALVNGERWALMLFGVLTLMVILGTRSIDRKGRARDPEAWDRFDAVTSNVPFMAITQGRNSLKLGEIGWRALAGLAVAALLMLAHQRFFGVAAITWP
ncbi:MAG TPA: NnrU family protein [Terricaulis sp.]|nr:NnrU family protein [Terricaulis sp.]